MCLFMDVCVNGSKWELVESLNEGERSVCTEMDYVCAYVRENM